MLFHPGLCLWVLVIPTQVLHGLEVIHTHGAPVLAELAGVIGPPGGASLAPPQPYFSYNQFMRCQPGAHMQLPRNAEDLQKMIKKGIKSKTKVKVIGGLYSATNIICTEGVPIMTKYLNYAKIHPDDTATFGSGLELEKALEALHKMNRTLTHVPLYGGLTIGGAIATGAHGSSLNHPTSLSDQILEVWLIDGKGDFRRVAKEDGEDFQAVGVHLGVLGAIVNVTMTTVPLFKMRVENYPDSEQILLDGRALEEAKNSDFYQVFWFPNNQRVVVSKGNKTGIEEEGDARTHLIPDLSEKQIETAHLALEQMQMTNIVEAQYVTEAYSFNSLHMPVEGKPPIFEEKGQFVNPATGYGHRLMSNKCNNKCPWDNGKKSLLPETSAMAFDLEQLSNVTQLVKRVVADHSVAFSMSGIVIRFAKRSENLMALEQGRDTVHFTWATPMRVDPYVESKTGIGAYQSMLQAMIQECDGRPHWAKNGPYYLNQEMIQRNSPKLNEFRAAVRKFDPEGLFRNKFAQRLMGEGNELTWDPKVIHCALQDYCLCQDDADCHRLQVCKKWEEKYSICEDVVPLVFQKPIPEGLDYANFSSISSNLNKF